MPNTAHHICRRRRGLVPRALRPYLAQRNAYKKLAATADVAERKRYEARRTALKWVLVTTFGYQGFENATFGHIAAHEAITAWGREILLQAKEAAEARGFEMLHALTDSLYVHRHGATMAEADALASAVTARTGITLAVEGRFDWIVFPPARSRPASGVATRYFGRYEDGSLKLRGIRVRQHGPPPIVAQAQAAFLSIMQGCRSRQELNACRSQLREELSRWHARLHSGAVPCSDLLVRARVSREADQYKARTAVAECLRKLLAHGISIPAGRTVEYLIVDRSHPDPSERYLPVPMVPVSHHYDVQAYRALLEDAFMEVTACLDAPISLVRGYAQLPLWSAGHVRTIYGEADVVGGLSTGLVPRA